jgi:hypothetical protein
MQHNESRKIPSSAIQDKKHGNEHRNGGTKNNINIFTQNYKHHNDFNKSNMDPYYDNLVKSNVFKNTA